MPTVLYIAAYRFFFYSNENAEPHHIHVQRDTLLVKYWLQPISLASSVGFSAHELNKLLTMVTANQKNFVEAWDEFFAA